MPIPLSSQVGGHPGVQTTEDGSLIIKPALKTEHDFYTLISSTTDENLQRLRKWIPKFYGTLKLMDTGTNLEGVPAEALVAAAAQATKAKQDEKESLVLQNLSHGFSKPNILDVKLGTQLYDDYDEKLTEEKKERMLRVARETTSWETGVRLTGFQVYDTASGQPILTPKAYGKSIPPSQLPEGTSKFFPASSSPSSSASRASSSSSSSLSTLGLPAPLLLPLLTHILHDTKDILAIFRDLELRMVGGSLLVVYEGDLDRVKGGVAPHREPKAPRAGPSTSAKKLETKTEKKKKGDDDEESEDPGEEVSSDDSVASKHMSDATSSSSEDESSDLGTDELEELEGGEKPLEGEKKPSTSSSSKEKSASSSTSSSTPLYRVRLIDFAHTHHLPGKGPDEGVIKGLETVVKLFEERVRAVREIIANE